jgi:1,4-dihydroxy-2-naphthoyl-CoA synthase
MDEFTGVLYEVEDGLAWITIDRPERYNSFRARTVDELVVAFKRAWVSEDVGGQKQRKQSFNSDTEHFAGVGHMAYSSLELFGETPEAKEGIAAFNEKRVPDFSAFRGN